MIEFVLPIKTVNPTNNRQHWRTVWQRSKKQREVAYYATHERWPEFPCVVTMTRLSIGTLDDDNLRPALKSIRDGIADAFRLPDNDPRIEWRYAQEKCKRGAYGVRIKIEAKNV